MIDEMKYFLIQKLEHLSIVFFLGFQVTHIFLTAGLYYAARVFYLPPNCGNYYDLRKKRFYITIGSLLYYTLILGTHQSFFQRVMMYVHVQ
ncbi:hypothetical protein QBC43DRAFT_317649 [Cladorrhinum sp. PSN259]|nr:hypothetical protein QBC43DRAFT_317649 [Cladorrhinum sp. PSN259]